MITGMLVAGSAINTFVIVTILLVLLNGRRRD